MQNRLREVEKQQRGTCVYRAYIESEEIGELKVEEGFRASQNRGRRARTCRKSSQSYFEDDLIVLIIMMYLFELKNMIEMHFS